MEIRSTNGSITRLKPDSTTILGRKTLPNSNDLSISRNHISFDLISSPNSPTNQSKNPRVSFQVIGKNPVWIYSKFGDKKVKTLKRFEEGELGFDDLFCFSGKNPNWFAIKKVEDDDLGENWGKRLELSGQFDEKLSESLGDDFGVDDDDDDDSNLGFDFVDVSNIDPVQEFGFLVIGHEFDQYPKKMTRDIKNWDWFLDDPVRDSDDEDLGESKGKKTRRRKRKKGSGDDDVEEEWTAESEGEELTTKVAKAQKLKYHTRSKDPTTSHKNRASTKTSSTTSRKEEREEEYEDDDEEEEEEDPSLGGFIVDDEIVEDDEEAENEIDDDEEDEFVEDENEMEE